MLAARGDSGGLGLVGLGGVEHLDSFGVGWVDNTGDIEVSEIIPSLEVNLAQHARFVGGSFTVGVPVTSPSIGEGLVDDSETVESERRNLFKTGVGGEDNGLGDAVLVDECDNVFGRRHGCKRGGCEKDGVDELHLEKSF